MFSSLFIIPCRANLVECVFNIFAVLLVRNDTYRIGVNFPTVLMTPPNIHLGMSYLNSFFIQFCRNYFAGILLSYVACIMTFWKTVIYFMCSYNNITAFSHLSWSDFILLFIIPNGIWIVVPLLFIIGLTSRIYNNNKNKYKTS